MTDVGRIPLLARDGTVRAFALVDVADLDAVTRWRWSPHGQGYAYRQEPVDGKRRSVLLHRWLLGLEHGDRRQGDHLNGDRLDCRRENLRIVTGPGNSQNMRSRGGSSRFRGVYRVGRRWAAKVGPTQLGRFDTEIEAALVAEARRRERWPFALPDPELVAIGEAA